MHDLGGAIRLGMNAAHLLEFQRRLRRHRQAQPAAEGQEAGGAGESLLGHGPIQPARRI